MKWLATLFIHVVLMPYRTFAADPIENYDITFMLPIDWSTAKHQDLLVKIPKGYQSIQPLSTWDKATLIEFIPQEEEPANWSQIITISKFIKSKISAKWIIERLIKQISQKVKTQIILKEISNEKHQTGFFILKYKFNQKTELLGAKYLSGPYDCEGVQYTIRLGLDQAEEEAIQNIKAFFRQQVQLIENEHEISGKHSLLNAPASSAQGGGIL